MWTCGIHVTHSVATGLQGPDGVAWEVVDGFLQLMGQALEMESLCVPPLGRFGPDMWRFPSPLAFTASHTWLSPESTVSLHPQEMHMAGRGQGFRLLVREVGAWPLSSRTLDCPEPEFTFDLLGHVSGKCCTIATEGRLAELIEIGKAVSLTFHSIVLHHCFDGEMLGVLQADLHKGLRVDVGVLLGRESRRKCYGLRCGSFQIRLSQKNAQGVVCGMLFPWKKGGKRDTGLCVYLPLAKMRKPCGPEV